MFRHINVLFWILGMFFLLLACKKSSTSKTQLASLDLTDAYALIIPQDTVTSSNPASANILYKLTSASALTGVNYINADGFNIGSYYAPEYFYHINPLYFLATFSLINSNPLQIESFIINYSNGKAFKLPEGFYPMKLNGSAWVQETYEKPIKAGPNNSYYFKGQDRVFEITQTALDLFNTEVIDISGTSATNFEVDLQGDIMVGNTIYSSPTISYQSVVFTPENSYASSSFVNGFSILKLTNNQIQTFHSYVQNNQLIEDTTSIIDNQGSGWQYLGTYEFLNPDQLIYVFNQGMVVVYSDSASILKLNNLPLSSIVSADQSGTHLFLNAINSNSETVFLQITPTNNPPTYTEIFTPNQYLINHINVYDNDDFVYQAKRLDNNIQVFGYYSATFINEVINYKNIIASQLITIK